MFSIRGTLVSYLGGIILKACTYFSYQIDGYLRCHSLCQLQLLISGRISDALMTRLASGIGTINLSYHVL